MPSTLPRRSVTIPSAPRRAAMTRAWKVVRTVANRTMRDRCTLRTLPFEGMDRRIFGLENEYGVTCTLRGQRRLSPDEVARYLFRRVVSWGRSSNVFLENGARLYLDVGSHPEYATPECDSIYDPGAHHKAGGRVPRHPLARAEQRPPGGG